MTRESVAQLIHWNLIIWAFGIVNVVAMLPQLAKLVRTKETKGLSTGMFWIYFWIQVAFSFQGFFRRDEMLMWCLGLSAVVSITIIVLIYRYRKAARMKRLEKLAHGIIPTMRAHIQNLNDLKMVEYHGFQKCSFKDIPAIYSLLRDTGYDTRSLQIEVIKVERDQSNEIHFHKHSDAFVVVLDHGLGFRDPCNARAYINGAWKEVLPQDAIPIPRGTRHGFTVDNGGVLWFLSVQSPPITDFMGTRDDYVRVSG